MLFNKIAAAILVVGISAMAIGKISTIILPHSGAGVHHTAGDGGTTPVAKPDPGWPAAMADADPKAGKKVSGKCVSCHTLNKGGPNRVGPNLYGIAGRKPGTKPGFSYSSGMKKKGGTWTLKSLYTFLKNPGDAVSGTKMTYRLSKWQQRRDLIAYLASLGDKKIPLPDVPKPKKADEPKKGDKAPVKKTEKMPAKKAAAPKQAAMPKKAAPKKEAMPKKAAAPKKEAMPKKVAAPKKAAAPKKEAMPKKAMKKEAMDKKEEAPATAPAKPKDAEKTDGKKDDKKDDN
jgi:cytochrome c